MPEEEQERYRLLTLLGQGGTGSVYKALDLVLNRTIAIKILHPALSTDNRYVELLKQEVRLASQISHCNVVRVFDLGYIHGTVMVTMSLVDGKPLSRRISEKGRLSPEEATFLFKQLCAGVNAAHEAGVVHRDLKPQNLLIDHNEHLYITDFGLAISITASGDLSVESDEAPGTVAYMAPEQRLGLSVDHRCDIFALGLILRSMLTGAMPNIDASNLERDLPLDRTTNATIAVDTETPAGLKKVILRCLQINPLDRYQSVSELIGDLDGRECRSHIDNHHRSSKSALFVYVLKAWLKRRVAIYFGIIGSTLLFILLLSATSLRQLPQLFRNTQIAIAEFRSGLDAGRRGRHVPELQAAAEHFDKAIKADDRYLPALLELSKTSITLYQKTGSSIWLEQARRATELAMKVDPDSVDVRLAVAGLRVAQGRHAEARDAVERVLAVDPMSESGFRILAKSHIADGNTHAAIAAAQQAVNLGPASWVNHGVLAAALLAARREREASNSYLKVLDLDPDNLDAYNNLGIISLRRGYFQKAVEYFERALDIDATAVVYSNTGTAYFLAGRYKMSAVVFEKAVNLVPDNSTLRGNLAEAYRWSGERAKADSELNHAVRLAGAELGAGSNDPNLISRLSVYYAKQGDFSAAEGMLRRLKFANDTALYASALVKLLRGRTTEAVIELDRALKAGYLSHMAFADPNWGVLVKDKRYLKIMRHWTGVSEPQKIPKASSTQSGRSAINVARVLAKGACQFRRSKQGPFERARCDAKHLC